MGKQGNFLVQNKKNCEKKFQIFFQLDLTYSNQKLKILIFKTKIVLIFYCQILIFGPDMSVSILENLHFGSF